jgi:hypothetical protein
VGYAHRRKSVSISSSDDVEVRLRGVMLSSQMQASGAFGSPVAVHVQFRRPRVRMETIFLFMVSSFPARATLLRLRI